MWGVFNCTRVYFFWSTGADGNVLAVPRIGLQSDFFCSNHGTGPVAQTPWQKLCGRRSIAAWTGIKHPTFPENYIKDFMIENFSHLKLTSSTLGFLTQSK